MTDFLLHLESAYNDLRKSNGDFAMFAIFQPEGTDGRWDLVLSAPWLKDELQSYSLISKAVERHLAKKEMALLGRLAIIDIHDPSVKKFAESFAGGKSGAVVNFSFAGASITRAHVFAVSAKVASGRTI